MALGTDLISHYALDSDLTDGVGSNDLTKNGTGGSYVTGKLSNGYDDENTSDLENGSMSGLETDPSLVEITIDLWFNLQSNKASANNYLFHIDPSGITGGDMVLAWDGINYKFRLTFYDQSTNQSVYSPAYGSPPTSQWIHLLGWYDQAEFGLLVDNADHSWLGHNGLPSGTIVGWDFYLLNNSAGSSSTRADAIIDNVGLWTRKLTEAERDMRYNAGNGLAYPFPVPGKSTVLIL